MKITDIKTHLSWEGIDPNSVNNLEIKVHSWTNPNSETPFTDAYPLQFVEKLQVAKLEGYNNLISIEPTLLLTLSDPAKATAIVGKVREGIAVFVAGASSKNPIVLAKLLENIKKTEGVAEAAWTEAEFIIKKDGVIAADKKIINGAIVLNDFEKVVFADDFLIATTVSKVAVTVTMTIKILLPHVYEVKNETPVKAALTESLTSFFATLKNGQKLIFKEVQDTIANTDIGFLFNVEVLEYTVREKADLSNRKDFSFKISEQVVFTAASITITPEPKPV